jgi:RNA polymerase primary sigma factor
MNSFSLAEERTLLDHIRTGDMRARERMILANRPLVYKLAHRYKHLGIPLDDLIHEGYLGLLHAIDRFQPRGEARLATYATWWVHFHIRRAIATLRWPVSLPPPVMGQLYGLRRCLEELSDRLGHSPTDRELAHTMGCSATHIRTLRAVSGEFVAAANIDREIPPDPTPLDQLAHASLHHELQRGLERLSSIESRVLHLRYGLGGQDPLPQEAVGRRCHMNRTQVREIEKSALKKLRTGF